MCKNREKKRKIIRQLWTYSFMACWEQNVYKMWNRPDMVCNSYCRKDHIHNTGWLKVTIGFLWSYFLKEKTRDQVIKWSFTAICWLNSKPHDYTRFIQHSSAAEVETLTLSGICKTGLFKLFNVKDPKNINPPFKLRGPTY